MLAMRDGLQRAGFKSKAVLVAGGLTLLGAGTAGASTIAIDFGTLSDGASDAQIQSFMDSLLPSGSSVVVTGAVASDSYNADGHVTGPGKGSTSFTLAQLDPSGHGTFIENNTGNSSNEITMLFSGLTIASLSFDFEIFPDGSCPSLSACGGSAHPNLPDLTLVANGSQQVVEYTAVVPGQAGSYNTTYIHSPASGQFEDELAPQLLGSSGTLNLAAGTTELEFQDWPATIAVNNLVINTPSNPVPEPATITLLGTGLIGLGLVRRRRADAELQPNS
jgi:PEP-CTERM motif